MIEKLPNWLVTKWASKVAKLQEADSSFPKFKVFVDFVTRESNIVNNPITSLSSLRPQKGDGNR